ncbi:MAG: nicotinate-nucleotide adenylyltransferase [Bacteroidetes bacterium]|nr:nicotinate-nucleotide adenylyltransferase [Bacteroidota bacterium]
MKKYKKTGLFFGSFNPIHIGHLAIANYMMEFTDLDRLWFVVSPQNPLKEKKNLLADYHRLELVHRAIGDSVLFRASNIEFSLPKPSYTIDTLTYLSEKHPDHSFVLIVGADSLETFRKWKNYELILERYEILVYPRPGSTGGEFTGHKNVRLTEAPLIEISSSFIRDAIRQGKDMRYFLPEKVYEYITLMNFYKK